MVAQDVWKVGGREVHALPTSGRDRGVCPRRHSHVHGRAARSHGPVPYSHRWVPGNPHPPEKALSRGR